MLGLLMQARSNIQAYACKLMFNQQFDGAFADYGLWLCLFCRTYACPSRAFVSLPLTFCVA